MLPSKSFGKQQLEVVCAIPMNAPNWTDDDFYLIFYYKVVTTNTLAHTKASINKYRDTHELRVISFSRAFHLDQERNDCADRESNGKI